MTKGIFITFESGEALGKTTQIKLLYDRLVSEGKDVIMLREPGGTPAGEIMRDLIKNPEYDISTPTEILLFYAARSELASKVIRPSLEQGKIVLCDRYNDSSIVYQGVGRGITFTFLDQLFRFTTGGLQPDITFVLDGIPFRERDMGCRMEHEDWKDLHQKAYTTLGQMYDRYKIINVNRPIEIVHEDIYNITHKALPLLG